MRPLRRGEAIDLAARVFRTLGWPFLRLSFVPALLCTAAIGFVLQYALPGLYQTTHPNDWFAQVLDTGMALAIATLVGGPLYLIGVASVTAGVASLTSDYMLGNVPDEESALGVMARKLGALVRLSIREAVISLWGVFVALGLFVASSVLDHLNVSGPWSGLTVGVAIMGIALGGVVFLVVRSNHALAPVALVLENLGPRAAAKRSSFLVNRAVGIGNVQSSVVELALACLLVLVLVSGGLYLAESIFDLSDHWRSIVSGFPLPGIWIAAFDWLKWFLSLWVILPLWATGATLIYYDRRVQLEGYDVDCLAQEVWRTDGKARFQL